MQTDNINDIASKHLGQSGSYATFTDQFDPTLLVPMPRELARKDWHIKGDEFVGMDVWHCHEATFLLNNGLPIAGTLKFIYSSNSEYMVESKSMKLYLNSFDMCKLGETIKEATQNYINQIKTDLSNVLKTEIDVHFFYSYQEQSLVMNNPAVGYQDIFLKISTLCLENLTIDDYAGQKKHLTFRKLPLQEKDSHKTYRLKTNILRSRCRHTKQKDTGEALIYLKVKNNELDIASLLKEIISLREVNEFHEFCAEKLFVELKSHSEVVDCCVILLYSRRGSLDINPVRSTNIDLVPIALQNASIYTKKQMGQ